MRRVVRVAVVVFMAVAVIKWHVLGGVLDAVVVVAGFRYSLRRHPLVTCPRCHGSKGHRDWWWIRAFGSCRVCHGNGTLPRPGVVVFRSQDARRIRAGEHGRWF
jgi:hypothetical protein